MATPTLELPLTEAAWDALEDPPGGRLEVLDGMLVVSPSADGEHQRICHGLVVLLEQAASRAGGSHRVLADVEWRHVADGYVRDAPRPDVALGPCPDEAQGTWTATGPPLLAFEVLSPSNHIRSMRFKRHVYRDRGLRWYVEIARDRRTGVLGAALYDLAADVGVPLRTATDGEVLELLEPLPLAIVPAALPDVQRAAALAAARAEAESARAEAEAARAEAEAARADRLAEQLRALGADPGA